MSSGYRSRAQRRNRPARGENLAPALFPFLAVLVCTMGALVLILVLVVSQASASANRPTPADEKLMEASDSVHLMSEEMIAQRDRQQDEIERRRLELTAMEDHISRLVTELDHYREMAKALDARLDQSENERTEQLRKVDDLESKIELEKDKLEKLKEKSKGNSPAFAIFPYQGKNGTTRRPIYLECVEAGVIIQPEGTLVSINDLKPPFGPGNPLDASLRLIRSEFQKLDPSSSSGVSPYPLLLVRPNGIKSYVLARAAMAGWDDQFGYELLDQNMPLAFPPTIPGLANQLETNLIIARERQIALAAAMPRRYAGGQPWEEDFDALDSSGNAGSGGGGSSGGGAGSGDNASDGDLAFGEDWTAIDSTFVRSPVQPSSRAQMTNGSPSQSPSNALNNRLGGYQNQAQPAPRSQANATANSIGSSTANSSANDASQFGGNTTPITDPSNGSAFNPAELNGAVPSAGQPGSSPAAAEMFSPSDSSFSQNSDAASAETNTGMVNGPNSGSAAFGNSNPNQSSGINSQSASGGSTSLTQSNTLEPAQSGQDPSQAYSPMTARDKEAMNASPSNATSSNANSSDKRSNATASTSSNGTPTKQAQAKSPRRPRSNDSGSAAGHNWSSRRYSPNSTAVSRPMNIVVMEDRWLVMRDDAVDKIETTITMDKGPLEARNQLFQTISDRVDSWGVAVSEGYWQPKLTIEVTPQAGLSAQRLQKLLEGSELDAEFVPLQSQKR
jgi:hypothetical protein